MATEVHATSWPSLDHGAVTAAPGDAGVTESQGEQRKDSGSHDQDWAEFFNNYLQTGGAGPTSTDNMGLGLLGLDENIPSQFGTMDTFAEHDTMAATTSSSLASSVCDPSSAPHPYQAWPAVHRPQLMGYEQQPVYQQHGPWYPEQQFEQPLNFGLHHADGGLGIQMPPTSHPYDNQNMQFNQAFMSHESPVHGGEGLPDMGHGWSRHEQSVTPHEDLFGDDDERDSTDPADPCYAQLLYQCLKEAPNYTLSLRELYDWVAQHSQKAKDPKNRGWQNSVRHNLSMNAAFARVPHSANAGPKKGSLWRLTEEALRDGVISTTRYRKDPKRKPERRAVPALSRQASGAKGGRATRDATRFRQQQQQQHRGLYGLPAHRIRRGHQCSPYMSRSAETSPQPGMIPPTPASSPYFMEDPANMPLPSSAPQTPPNHFHSGPSTPPPGFQLMESKPPMAYNGNFEFLPLDYPQQNIFGDHDPEMAIQHDPNTPTPSLMTEASFMTDDNVPPSAMMVGDVGQQTNYQ